MRFAQRNVYYLRASPRVVLQTVLHIDPKHLRWMNSKQYSDGVVGEDDDASDEEDEYETTGDEIFARALNGLRTVIMPKLMRESADGQLLSSTNKKEKTDVFLQPDFRMAYFFRTTTGRHAVLLKEKTLTFPQRQMGPPTMSATAMRTYQSTAAMPPSRLAAQQHHNDSGIVAEGEAIAEERSDGPGGSEAIGRATGMTSSLGMPSSSGGVRKRRNSSPEVVEQRHVRVKQEDEDEAPSSSGFEWTPTPTPEERTAETRPAETIAIEDTIDDKKPKLEVSYSGFQIFGKCLVLVIEPTSRTRRRRPGLFQTVKPKEKSQLSATPMPEISERAPSARAPSRLPSATPGVGRQLDLDRADSRRLATPGGGNGALFRGTPSDWEPTPPPASRRGSEVPGFTPGPVDDGQSVDDDEEDIDNFGGARLASQMLESSQQKMQGNDIDD